MAIALKAQEGLLVGGAEAALQACLHSHNKTTSRVAAVAYTKHGLEQPLPDVKSCSQYESDYANRCAAVSLCSSGQCNE